MASADYVDLPIYRDELASALRFTVADLEANRLGRLTLSQRRTQRRALVGSAAISIFGLALGLGFCVIAFVEGIATLAGLRILLLAAVFLAIAGLGARTNLPLWLDLQAGRVASIEGRVQPAEQETVLRSLYGSGIAMWSFYWLVDASQRFRVSGRAYGVLTPARHRLYFLSLIHI